MLPERFSTLLEWEEWVGTERGSMQYGPQRLAHIQAMAARLGCYPLAIPIITVGGTNGKGTAVHTLASFLQRMGYRVGAYFSPHLFSPTERIVTYHPKTSLSIAKQKHIPQERLLSLLSEVARAFAARTEEEKQHFSEGSYFEYLTLAALLFFQKELPDYIVLEVGLGGRLDTVNIWDPVGVILTSIGWDHMALLGDSLDKIALEKAGIFRPQIPVVLTETAQRSILQKRIANMHMPAYVGARDSQQAAYELLVLLHAQWPDRFPPPQKLSVLDRQMIDLLPGRFDCWVSAAGVIEIIDIAHNLCALSFLWDKIEKLFGKNKHIHILWYSLRDKDLKNMAAFLMSKGQALYMSLPSAQEALECGLPMARAPCLQEMTQVLQAEEGHCPILWSDSWQESWELAHTQAEPGDIILIVGSFYRAAAGLLQRAIYQYA